jgi:hypothetical protein
MRYAVVIEKAGRNYSVYVPDLPGCVATGDTIQEAVQKIGNAISKPPGRTACPCRSRAASQSINA